MSKNEMTCAMGDADELPIAASATVDLDSLDTNHVLITGGGAGTTISSFGSGTLITKQVRYENAGTIIHHNPPALALGGGVDHTTTANEVASYRADRDGNWTEEGSVAQILALQAAVAALQAQVNALTTRVTALETWKAIGMVGSHDLTWNDPSSQIYSVHEKDGLVTALLLNGNPV